MFAFSFGFLYEYELHSEAFDGLCRRHFVGIWAGYDTVPQKLLCGVGTRGHGF